MARSRSLPVRKSPRITRSQRRAPRASSVDSPRLEVLIKPAQRDEFPMSPAPRNDLHIPSYLPTELPEDSLSDDPAYHLFEWALEAGLTDHDSNPTLAMLIGALNVVPGRSENNFPNGLFAKWRTFNFVRSTCAQYLRLCISQYVNENGEAYDVALPSGFEGFDGPKIVCGPVTVVEDEAEALGFNCICKTISTDDPGFKGFGREAEIQMPEIKLESTQAEVSMSDIPLLETDNSDVTLSDISFTSDIPISDTTLSEPILHETIKPDIMMEDAIATA